MGSALNSTITFYTGVLAQEVTPILYLENKKDLKLLFFSYIFAILYPGDTTAFKVWAWSCPLGFLFFSLAWNFFVLHYVSVIILAT